MSMFQHQENQFEEDLSSRSKPYYNCFGPYITRKGAQGVKDHKYSGADDGYSYIYLYNPLAKYLVEKLPRYVAPNTLTLLGFLHTLFPVVLLYVFIGNELYGDVPRWFCFVQAWCYFTYRMFDECDGKQARRTGNSSALGLLFDHGCDCFSVGFQQLILFRILQMGNNFITFFGVVTIYAAFHFATLEEYYTGTLYLPPLNGVSDGSIVIIIATFISGCTTNALWASEVLDGSWLHLENLQQLTVGQLTMMIIIVGTTGTYIFNWRNTIKTIANPKDTQSETVHLPIFIGQIIAYFAFATMFLVVGYIGNEPIVGSQYGLNLSSGYQIAWLCWFFFIIVHQTMCIQLAHVTHTKYNPLSRIYVFNFLGAFVICMVAVAYDGDVNTGLSVVVLLLVTIVTQWIFILTIIREIPMILGIRVFHVKPETLDPEQNQGQQLQIQEIVSDFENPMPTNGDDNQISPDSNQDSSSNNSPIDDENKQRSKVISDII